MICVIWIGDTSSVAPWRFLISVVSVRPLFCRYCYYSHATRQVMNWWYFSVPFVLRHRFLAQWWQVSNTCFHRHITYSIPRIVLLVQRDFFPTLMVYFVSHRTFRLMHICCWQDQTMFWAFRSMWSKGRHVLFLNCVTPATQAAMRRTWVRPGEECGPNGLIIWRRRGGGKWCWSVFCE